MSRNSLISLSVCPVSSPITLSGNSILLASLKSSSVRGPFFNEFSISTIICNLSINHLSIFVMSCITDGSMPLLKPSAIFQILLSSTTARSSKSSSSVRPVKSYDIRLSTCCSSERIAFIRPPSKLSDILITSPVAFICVVSVLFAEINLSNGSLGILTTQ